MELTSELKRIIFKFSFISLTFCVLLWFSIFSYGLLYYLYIPSIAHIKPVHLRYDSRCSADKTCSFPYHNISLVEKGHHELLSAGQAYAIELALEMPESENNINQGMFMVHLDMLSKTGEVLKSTRRPVMLHYRSPLFKIIYTLFFVPALLAGTLEEKQSLSVPLFEKFVENCNEPTFYAFIEIESTAVEVYSCSLRIHAQFTGLRYMMYYWPTLSALVGIGTNFFFIAIIVIFIWIRQIVNTSQYIDVSALTQNEQDLVNEIRQSVQRSQARKPLDSYPEEYSRVGETSDSENEGLEVEDISPHGVDKPQGRMSAYAFFVQTCRDEFMEKHPNEPIAWSGFAKRTSERWQNMTEKEKERFQQMAENDKKRYQSEMENYITALNKHTKDRQKVASDQDGTTTNILASKINEPGSSTPKQEDQLSDEIANITNLTREPKKATSLGLRKRLVAE